MQIKNSVHIGIWRTALWVWVCKIRIKRMENAYEWESRELFRINFDKIVGASKSNSIAFIKLLYIHPQ